MHFLPLMWFLRCKSDICNIASISWCCYTDETDLRIGLEDLGGLCAIHSHLTIGIWECPIWSSDSVPKCHQKGTFWKHHMLCFLILLSPRLRLCKALLRWLIIWWTLLGCMLYRLAPEILGRLWKTRAAESMADSVDRLSSSSAWSSKLKARVEGNLKKLKSLTKILHSDNPPCP